MDAFGFIWQTFILLWLSLWSAISTNVEQVQQVNKQIQEEIYLPEGKCSEWYPTAVKVGWPKERLTRLGDIMWAESRCQHDVVSRTKDYGLTQINWAAHGKRLSEKTVDKENLLVPETNLREALWIADYAAEHYGCWSQPWYMSGNWC